MVSGAFIQAYYYCLSYINLKTRVDPVKHPHLSPADTWKSLFDSALSSSDPEEAAVAREVQHSHTLFTPSKRPAHEEMLRLLRENEADTITIVAIGPLTNLATAAATDPEAFLRAKEVVVMGGAIDAPGNVPPPPLPHLSPTSSPAPAPPPFNLIKQPATPLRAALNRRNQMTPGAEFNTYADSVAAARVFALTSPNPASMMPPVAPAPPGKQSADPPPPFLSPYPKKLSRQLKLTLCPLGTTLPPSSPSLSTPYLPQPLRLSYNPHSSLFILCFFLFALANLGTPSDITTPHELTRGQFTAYTASLLSPPSSGSSSAPSPLAEWSTAFLSSTFRKIESLTPNLTGDAVGLSLHDPLCIWYVMAPHMDGWRAEVRDVRVETSGQWTRGCCVVDRRSRKRREDDAGEVGEDAGNWLSERLGNRVRVCVGSPGFDIFGGWLLERVYGEK